jgi:hypothetical protein
MEAKESMAYQPPGAAARARERERKLKAKVEEEVAAKLTVEVKTVNVLELEGERETAGQRFEVWNVSERSCLVVAHPNRETGKAIVCMEKAGRYLVKYLVHSKEVDRATLATEPLALAFENE